jgi:hypothetical protein
MADRGRIICGQCGRDLGPSAQPDETSIEDMCEACLEQRLRESAAMDAEAARDPVITVSRGSNPLCVHVPVDPRIQTQLDDLRKRIDVLERLADRKE